MTEIYGEPLFFLFPVASILIGAAAYMLTALPLTWISIADPLCLRKYRLQPRPEMARRSFAPSLLSFAGNILIMLGFSALAWPALRYSGVHAGEHPDILEIASQLAVFIVVDDICFYFIHRLLHTRWLYRHVHAIHHRMTAPSAISGGYFHPVEYVLINLAALTGPLLVGAHVVTIWIWAILRQALAADGHCGYAFPWSPARLLPGYPGPAHHDMHHRRFVVNYANYLSVLDRWLGTLASDCTRPDRKSGNS